MTLRGEGGSCSLRHNDVNFSKNRLDMPPKNMLQYKGYYPQMSWYDQENIMLLVSYILGCKEIYGKHIRELKSIG